MNKCKPCISNAHYWLLYAVTDLYWGNKGSIRWTVCNFIVFLTHLFFLYASLLINWILSPLTFTAWTAKKQLNRELSRVTEARDTSWKRLWTQCARKIHSLGWATHCWHLTELHMATKISTSFTRLYAWTWGMAPRHLPANTLRTKSFPYKDY